jgi:heat shock protein HtpX
MKRIALFVLTNLAIMIVLMVFLTVLSAVFGINFNVGGRSLNLGSLAIFSLVVGFTGAIISLLMSKPMAKWSTGAQVIRQPSNAMESWLVDTVRRHAEKAGIGMPEVAVYNGEPNAFATGAFKNSALVAVSTGLLQSMSKEEVEAVLAHEISHVSNGDMVTMTLLQGIVNAFAMFLARAIADNPESHVIRDLPEVGEQIAIPFMVFYKTGNMVKVTSDVHSKAQVKEMLDKEFSGSVIMSEANNLLKR